jgi:Zn-dependent protease
MFESSISLGRILGIRVGLHYTWFIIFGLVSLSLSSYFQAAHADWGTALAWLTAVVTAGLFFASIVLHELGHSVVAMAHGIPVRSITLFVFGGLAQTERDAATARAEFWIAIAGPMVSLALAGFFHLVGLLAGDAGRPVAVACDWLATINFAVAVFNMLPGFPLDGGRVFRSLVWGASGNPAKGMRWAVTAGRMVAYGMMGIGFVIAVTTGQLVSGIWLGLIGWFLLIMAESSGRQWALAHVRRGGHARDIMRADAPHIPADMSVRQWINDHVLAHGERAFLVQRGEEVVGLVSLSDARKIAAEHWPDTPLSAIMTPRERLHAVSPETGLAEILGTMSRHGVNQLPVVDAGHIRGWIDRDRVLRAMQVIDEATSSDA